MYRLFLIALPTIMLAAETDIVPRTVNFVIFLALMYYWTAKHFRNIYNSRINLISGKLNAIENQLSLAEKNKEDAQKRIEKAQKDAEEIIALAKVQAKAMSEKIIKDAEQEAEMLAKSYEEQKQFDEKSAKAEIIDSLIDEMLDAKLNLSQEELLKIISRKVA